MSYAKQIGSFLADLIIEMVIVEETTLSPLANAKRLPDNDQWKHRFEIHSGTSDRKYIVSQNKAKKHWGCSCPGWRTHRKCKHLAALGLPSHEHPHEVVEEGYGDAASWAKPPVHGPFKPKAQAGRPMDKRAHAVKEIKRMLNSKKTWDGQPLSPEQKASRVKDAQELAKQHNIPWGTFWKDNK